MDSKPLILVKLENNGSCLFCQEPPEQSCELKQYALQTLLQYLKMKKIKVEVKIEPGAGPSQSLVDLGESKVTAGLCGGCGSLVKEFLKLKRMMESCLESIQTKMEVGIEKDEDGMKYPVREGIFMKEVVQRCKRMIGTRTKAGDVIGQQQENSKPRSPRKRKLVENTGLKKSRSQPGAVLDELQVADTPLAGPSSASNKEPLEALNNENQADGSPFECFYCEKGFPEKSKLDKHSTIDTKKPSHGCEFCGKRFASCRILQTHAKSHAQVKKVYKCPKSKCAKSFAQKKYLDKHLKTHSDVRAFKCSQCGKAFKLQNTLTIHVQRVHDGVKNYECIFCNQTFFANETLNNHLRTHTNERPYICSKCGDEFAKAESLKRHMKSKH